MKPLPEYQDNCDHMRINQERSRNVRIVIVRPYTVLLLTVVSILYMVIDILTGLLPAKTKHLSNDQTEP